MQSIKRMNKMFPAVLALVFLAGCQQLTQKKQTANAHDAPARPTAVAGQKQAAASRELISVDFRLAQEQRDNGLEQLKFKDGSAVWYLPDPVLTRVDLSTAEPRRAQNGRVFVRFTFTPAGAQKLASITERFPGKFLVLTLGNSLQSVYRIQAPIANGVLDIGFGTAEEATAVVNRIAGQPS
uniref:SecDF P1 head subdomain-containing protein n=1 Tax=Castellaniella defragrans TaxID=75697 RepID=UPI0033424BC3